MEFCMGLTFFMILGVFLWIVGALWPSYMAKKKGYSFILFLLISWIISWLVALIIVLFLKDKNESPESRAASIAADAALAKEENQA